METTITAEQWAEGTTWTGIGLDKITKVANAKYPKAAYEVIGEGAGAAIKGKTDIKFPYARRRIERIFGPQAVGWRIVPDAQFGKVEAVEVTRRGTGEKPDYQELTVHLIGHVFEYAVLVPGVAGVQWLRSSLLSDAHTGYVSAGKARSYVYRGAWTSLLKQVLRTFGGFDHIYRVEAENLAETGEESTSATTGLTEITAKTEISAAKWSWLPAEAVDRIWRGFGSKTFGDLAAEVVGYLLTRPNCPAELQAYLFSLNKPNEPVSKPSTAAQEPAAKAGAKPAAGGNGKA